MILPRIKAIGIYNSQIFAKNIPASKVRTLSRFELELPMENGGISYIDSSSAPITTDMIICAKPGQTRHTKFPFKCYYIHMYLEEGLLYDTLLNTPDYFKTDKSHVYKALFAKLIKHYHTFAENDEILLQSLILELIYTISQDSSKQFTQGSIKKNNSILIENALKYIKGNLTENLSLEALAESTHLSPVHFHNLFKAAVGKTLHDYVEEQRIKKAIDLLISTDCTLTDVAFECGFSSQSYFSYVFKRRMQKTPREYVQEIYSIYEK